jgi:uncharacterized RDD family membrane protein YckC
VEALEPAPLLLRFRAALIDVSLIWLTTIGSLFDPEFYDNPLGLMLGVVCLLLSAASFALYLVTGQSLGKRSLGLVVVNLEGKPLGIARLAQRALYHWFFIAMSPLWLIDSLFIFSESRQCIHDRCVGSRVLRKPGKKLRRAEVGFQRF